MKKSEIAEEEARFDHVFGDPRELPTTMYCIVGHHEVPIGQVRTTPRGASVCFDCARTPKGQKELTPFDPIAGYRNKKAR